MPDTPACVFLPVHVPRGDTLLDGGVLRLRADGTPAQAGQAGIGVADVVDALRRFAATDPRRAAAFNHVVAEAAASPPKKPAEASEPSDPDATE